MSSSSLFNDTTSIGFPYAELADKRTQEWPLVESPWNVATLLALYLLMVRYAPKWMARHKPLQLRVPLFLYNLTMALINAHICLEFFTASHALNYRFSCQPCREDYNPHEMRIAAAFWWFYITKVFEFADTAFFILRHKWSQLSFLHVYHHSTMFIMCWIVVKWLPTGSSYVPGMINSFVHIIMYSYYALSTLGPRIQPYLWWKRYLTALQLLQFTIGFFWGSYALYLNCGYTSWILYFGGFYMSSFLFLFGRFYIQSYQTSTRKPNEHNK